MDSEKIKKFISGMNDCDRVVILRDLLLENKKDLDSLKDMIYGICDDCDGDLGHMCYIYQDTICSNCRKNCGCGNSFCSKHRGTECTSWMYL